MCSILCCKLSAFLDKSAGCCGGEDDPAEEVAAFRASGEGEATGEQEPF